MAKQKKADKKSKKESQPPKEKVLEEQETSAEEESGTEPEEKQPAKIKNCECQKVGKWWYCMRQDKQGHLVLCDGPFQTKEECDELAVCDE